MVAGIDNWFMGCLKNMDSHIDDKRFCIAEAYAMGKQAFVPTLLSSKLAIGLTSLGMFKLQNDRYVEDLFYQGQCAETSCVDQSTRTAETSVVVFFWC